MIKRRVSWRPTQPNLLGFHPYHQVVNSVPERHNKQVYMCDYTLAPLEL